MKKIKNLFLALAFSAFLIGCGSSTPSEIAKEFAADTFNGDYKVFIEYAYLPKDELKAGEMEALEGKFKQAVSQLKEQTDKKGGLKSIEILDEKVEEDKATVKYEAIFNDGSKATERLRFIKVDGEWKIDIFKSSIL